METNKNTSKSRVYYQLQKDCYIRQVGEYGYIKSIGLFNDLFLDNNGAKFLSVLSSENPKSLEALTAEIAKQYDGCKPEDILEDVCDFFDMLVEDGYVVKGNSISEVTLKNIGFTYANVDKLKLYDDYSPNHERSEYDTQDVMGAYLLEHPWLSSFQIELTSKCNERCIHCYIPHEYKNTSIEDKLYYRVLDELKELGTIGVTLSGGEPMAHPHFLHFLHAAKEKGFYVNILSNLTLLTEDIINEMGRINKCAVQVSLYSMVPEHHDRITSLPGSFEITKNNILKLIDNDIPLQINCPVMKTNKDDVSDVIRWGYEHKVKVNVDYAIMAEYDHQTGNLANRLSPEECRDVIKAILSFEDNYQKRIKSERLEENIKNINEDPEKPFCGVGISSCCMVANGNVYPCAGWQGYICGNLNKQSLGEIWFSSKEMNHLRSLRKKDIPKCLKCENKAFCSPCLGRFANESKTGNYLEVAQHFCDVAEVNKEVVMEFKKKL